MSLSACSLNWTVQVFVRIMHTLQKLLFALCLSTDSTQMSHPKVYNNKAFRKMFQTHNNLGLIEFNLVRHFGKAQLNPFLVLTKIKCISNQEYILPKTSLLNK